MLKRFFRVGIAVAVFAILCAGQQQRVPSGQTRGSGKSGSQPAQDPNGPKGVYPTSHGVLKSISGSLLLVEVDDEHEMKFRITRKTRFYSHDKQGTHEIKASSIQPGQTVDVDMQTSLDGSFEAMRVTLQSQK